MNAAEGSPSFDRVKSVAAHDANATPDDPDEQTLAGEKVHLKAKTAALRAEESEERHISALNRRIDILQNKLDLREEEVHKLLPRNAELEQARRNATINCGLSLAAISIGGVLASISSLFPSPFDYISGSFGAAMLIGGLTASWATHRFGWPPKN